MNTPTPHCSNETETVRAAYAALNRNDIPAFVTVFDPRVERIEPADSPEAGIFRGLDAVTAHIAKARGTWAEGRCEPEKFFVVGDRIIVLVHVRVRLKQEIEWREGRTADVFTFHNGKVIEFRTFFDERQAFEWAGVEASDAN